jgi:hypothetical protein
MATMADYIGFFTSAADLPRRLPGLVQRIYPDGALWVVTGVCDCFSPS